MPKFILSKLARDDLFEIWDYIAKTSIDQADHIERELEAAFLKLSEIPGMGHVREELTDKNLKFWPVFDFLVVYTSDSQPLEIITIVHGARELKAFFAKF